MDEPSSVPPPSSHQRRVIKRYSNRKLYDTKESRYVTLLDIAELIRAGEDVQVVDNATKEDKTDVTLALIISEELRARPKGIPLQTLRSLIRERGERLLAQLREGPIGKLVPWEPESPGMEGVGVGNPGGESSGAGQPNGLSEPGKERNTAFPVETGERPVTVEERVPSSPFHSPPSGQGASSAVPGATQRLRATIEQWQLAIDERIRTAIPNFSAIGELQQEVKRLGERVARVEGDLEKAKAELEIVRAAHGPIEERE
jgi:polyhydroxyalkanoate synthesis repressor PhaR